jgi:cation transport regulator ChaB
MNDLAKQSYDLAKEIYEHAGNSNFHKYQKQAEEMADKLEAEGLHSIAAQLFRILLMKNSTFSMLFDRDSKTFEHLDKMHVRVDEFTSQAMRVRHCAKAGVQTFEKYYWDSGE